MSTQASTSSTPAQAATSVNTPAVPGQELAEDRRDSHRIPLELLVREEQMGSYDQRVGNLGLGGVFFTAGHPPPRSRMDLRLRLPGIRDEVVLEAEVVRVAEQAGQFGIHLRFVEPPLELEMAVAKYLHQTH
jgi:hypothetical protein